MVANEVLKDKNISFKSKGIYAYLFSKPDEWDFSSNRIVLETKDARKSILSGLRELEDSGYLSREKLPNGRMEYTLKHSIALSPKRELRLDDPKSQNGTVPKRHSAKTGLISNIDNTSKIEEENNSIAVAGTAKEFIFEEELENLKNGGKTGIRKDYKIIALYWKKKGFVFENQEQFNSALTRELRAAKSLRGYSGEQIARSITYCAKEYSEIYTLETCAKRIADLVNKKTP